VCTILKGDTDWNKEEEEGKERKNKEERRINGGSK